MCLPRLRGVGEVFQAQGLGEERLQGVRHHLHCDTWAVDPAVDPGVRGFLDGKSTGESTGESVGNRNRRDVWMGI